MLNEGSEEFPEMWELKTALVTLQNKKASGDYRILSETLKLGRELLRNALIVLFNKCLHETRIPESW